MDMRHVRLFMVFLTTVLIFWPWIAGGGDEFSGYYLFPISILVLIAHYSKTVPYSSGEVWGFLILVAAGITAMVGRSMQQNADTSSAGNKLVVGANQAKYASAVLFILSLVSEARK